MGWNFLVVQWLGLHASTAGGRVQSLVGEIRSHKPKGTVKKKKKKKDLSGKEAAITAVSREREVYGDYRLT